jgi:uncharacterized integral membrane protein
MRLLSALVSLVVFVVLLVFALSNRQDVTVSLWPFDVLITAPLYIFTLGSLGMGLVFGAGFIWFRTIPHRLKTRRLGRDVVALSDKLLQAERELEQHRVRATVADTPLLTGSKWRFWER